MATSIEAILRFHKYTERIGSICGVNFIKKFVVSPKFVITLIDASTFLLVNLSSAWQQRENPDNTIYCIITTGFAIIALTMIYEFIRNNKIIMDMYEKAVVFHTVRQNDPRFRRTLNNYCRSLRTIKIMMASQILFTGIILGLYPLPASIYYKQFQLVFGFYLPFLDQTTPIGFTVNLLYQEFQILLAVFGLTYIGNVYISFILQVTVQYDALIDLLNDLKMIGAQNLNHQYDKVITNKLKIIIQEYQDQLNFISDLETLINKIMLVQIITASQSILSTLYIMIDHFFAAAIPVVVFSSASLFVACISGTFMENRAEDMMRAVYDTNWYLFATKDQKSLSRLLAVAQRPHNLTFGGQAYVNMRTFLDFCKRIYSFYMMMLKVK